MKHIIMKQYKSFDELLEMLRKVNPILRDSELLTDQIMDQLPKRKYYQKKGFRIADNSDRWIIFIGFRNIATFAALFLIGFFAYQQFEIMTKISSLENKINNQTNSPVAYDQIKYSNNAQLKSFLVKQLRSKTTAVVLSEDEMELIMVDRNSFNLLIREFEQFENENRKIKATALHQFLDSLKRYNQVCSKEKSL